MNLSSLDSTSIELIFLGINIFLLLSIYIGYKISSPVRDSLDHEDYNSLISLGAGLVSLLIFILAFIFSMAASEHTERKKNVLVEANSIGTAYLRADLLSDQGRDDTRKLLSEYVDVRMDGAENPEHLKESIEKSTQIHTKLWSIASTEAKQNPTENTSLVISALNDMIDMHEKRVTDALHSRISSSIWLALILISLLTMLNLGSSIRTVGTKSLLSLMPLLLAFSILVTLIIDLDRPTNTLIKVNQSAMSSLKNSIAP